MGSTVQAIGEGLTEWSGKVRYDAVRRGAAARRDHHSARMYGGAIGDSFAQSKRLWQATARGAYALGCHSIARPAMRLLLTRRGMVRTCPFS